MEVLNSILVAPKSMLFYHPLSFLLYIWRIKRGPTYGKWKVEEGRMLIFPSEWKMRVHRDADGTQVSWNPWQKPQTTPFPHTFMTLGEGQPYTPCICVCDVLVVYSLLPNSSEFHDFCRLSWLCRALPQYLLFALTLPFQSPFQMLIKFPLYITVYTSYNLGVWGVSFRSERVVWRPTKYFPHILQSHLISVVEDTVRSSGLLLPYLDGATRLVWAQCCTWKQEAVFLPGPNVGTYPLSLVVGALPPPCSHYIVPPPLPHLLPATTVGCSVPVPGLRFWHCVWQNRQLNQSPASNAHDLKHCDHWPRLSHIWEMGR